ncbi:class I adenylate-forming enzyme family protein [Micromonospora sp. NPDC047074]|uniref:class I adenylate-forming enzyme family protein n=1 Tax=Micromonospora sp. NPDC047074 TaxID=3154339 RepID=UPI0033EAF1EB
MIPPALDITVLERAARQPDRPLFVFDDGDRPVTVGEFADLAGRGAAVLAAQGVGRGDRIAVWAENGLAWLVLLAAAAWRGAALTTLHPGLTGPELTSALARSRPRRLFAAERVRDRPGPPTVERALAALPTGERPDGWHVLGADLGPAALAHLPGWDDPVPPPVGDPDAACNIQFTSGSTGPAKMVSLSAGSLLRNAAWTAEAAGLGGTDRIASPLPLAHAAGLGSGALLALTTGALWVSTRRFRTEPVLDQMARWECTVVQAVPTMASMLADRVEQDPGRWDLSSLRVGFLGGAACAPALLTRARRVLGLDRIAVVYGQTEAGPTISIDPGDGSCGAPGDTVGRVLPALAAAVVDPATRAPLPAGQAGELLVRGDSVTRGYVDDPFTTAATITSDGWLRTGDLGVLTDERVLTLAGRIKELIIRGGENIHPAEVEAALLAEPAVARACVLGVPSPRWGEEVAALVVAAPGQHCDPDRLVRAAAERLARHKVPTVIRTVADLPLLPSGKVDRLAARELLLGEGKG